MALLTFADIEPWVPQVDGNAVLVQEAVTEAQSLAGDYCDRTLESTAHTDYHDIFARQQTVSLRNYPVTGTVTVTEDAQETSSEQLESDEFTVDTDAGILTMDSGYFSRGERALKVEYTAGYTSNNIPAGLKRALRQLVAWVLESRGDVGVTEHDIDGYSATLDEMDGPVPARIGQMLQPFKKER